MARKAAAADPDSGTTNVNIADFQRTRDSVRLDLDMAAVFFPAAACAQLHISFVRCKQHAAHTFSPSSTPV